MNINIIIEDVPVDALPIIVSIDRDPADQVELQPAGSWQPGVAATTFEDGFLPPIDPKGV